MEHSPGGIEANSIYQIPLVMETGAHESDDLPAAKHSEFRISDISTAKPSVRSFGLTAGKMSPSTAFLRATNPETDCDTCLASGVMPKWRKKHVWVTSGMKVFLCRSARKIFTAQWQSSSRAVWMSANGSSEF
jgi:hypothetical protein